MNLNHTKNALTIIILLIAPAITFAQNQNTVDSLKTIIAETIEDTIKVHAYINLSSEYRNFNLDTALYYSDLALNKSLKINYKKGIADACGLKGIIRYGLNDYRSADSLFYIAIQIYKEINQQTGVMNCYGGLALSAYCKGENRSVLEYSLKALKIADAKNLTEYKIKTYNNIGVAYVNLGDYEKSIEYCLKALNIFEELGNIKNIADCNLNLGSLFFEIDEFDKAFKYTNKALELYIEHKDIRGQGNCFTNIGCIYKDKNKYDEALQYFNKAIVLHKKTNYLKVISINYNNIGSIYYETGKYDKANECFNKSLKISREIGNNDEVAESYYHIARVEIKLKKYTLAEEYCLKSIELFEQINEPYKQQRAIDVLSIIYYLGGEYKKSHDTHKKVDIIKDSLFNIEKAEKIAELEEKYLNEKLEKHNLILKLENNLQQTEIFQQKRFRNIYLIAFVFAIATTSMIFIQLKKKNSAYKFLVQKNINLLNKEKELEDIKEQTTLNKLNDSNKSTVADDKKEEIISKLRQLFEKEKLFKDFDLNIVQLAKRLSTNRSYLSQLINEELGKNYSDFINEYRVKEAIRMFSDYNKASNFSIEGIANEVGFKSISCFNPAFKKFTGITPSKFRRESVSVL